MLSRVCLFLRSFVFQSALCKVAVESLRVDGKLKSKCNYNHFSHRRVCAGRKSPMKRTEKHTVKSGVQSVAHVDHAYSAISQPEQSLSSEIEGMRVSSSFVSLQI